MPLNLMKSATYFITGNDLGVFKYDVTLRVRGSMTLWQQCRGLTKWKGNVGPKGSIQSTWSHWLTTP